MPVGTSAYVPLANITLGSSAASVTFSSISGSYRDLVLVVTGTGPTNDIYYRMNSDSGNNYPYVIMYGTGSAASSGSGSTTQGIMHYNAGTSVFNIVANFMDYSATDKHKTVLSRSNQADGFVMSYGSRWANTAAVTTLLIGSISGNFATGSTFALYGIAS